MTLPKAPVVPRFSRHEDFLDWADKLDEDEQLAAVAEIRKPLSGELYFLHNWFWIQAKADPQPGAPVPDDVDWIQMEDWSFQSELIVMLYEPGTSPPRRRKRMTVKKLRQAGITWLLTGMGLRQNNFFRGQHGVVISVEQERADDVALRYQGIWEHFPEWMQSPPHHAREWSTDDKTHANNSRFQSLPTKAGVGASRTLTWAIVDEIPLIEEEAKKDPNDIIEESLLPALRMNLGWIIGAGTGRGRAGWFWAREQIWREQEKLQVSRDPEEEWNDVFIPVTKHPRWTDERYRTALASAPNKTLFKRAYPRTRDEVFSASGFCIFDEERVSERLEDVYAGKHPSPVHYGVVDEKLVPSAGGDIRIYWPPESGHRYVLAMDPSKGRASGDFAATALIDVDALRFVAVSQGRYPRPRDFAILGVTLARLYNTALLVPEANVDFGLIDRLVETNYRNLYLRRSHDQGFAEEPRLQIGWITHDAWKSGTRRKMLSAFQDAIFDRQLVIPDENMLLECTTFVSTEEKPSGEAQPSATDDLIMCGGIAYYVATREPERIMEAKDWQADQERMDRQTVMRAIDAMLAADDSGGELPDFVERELREDSREGEGWTW